MEDHFFIPVVLYHILQRSFLVGLCFVAVIVCGDEKRSCLCEERDLERGLGIISYFQTDTRTLKNTKGGTK